MMGTGGTSDTRRRKVWPRGALALLLLAGLVAPGAEASADEDRVSLTGTFATEQFAVVAEVRIEQAAFDDLFTAGGEIVLENVTVVDLVADGGSCGPCSASSSSAWS